MAVFDANENLTPFHDDRGSGEYGAILFDQTQLRQVDPRWFDPQQWGSRATRVRGSGRGGAWFIDASHGPCVLRQYLRGGLVGRVNHDRHLWRGVRAVRSFQEFRLLRELLQHKLPVPQPVAACYLRSRFSYRAWIIVERLLEVRSLADLAIESPAEAPWAATGKLVARFHRQGLDHADLNAHNVLYNGSQKGWLIDLDRGRIRIPETGWREANLRRLLRSLRKVSPPGSHGAIEDGFAQLRKAYDAHWARGN